MKTINPGTLILSSIVGMVIMVAFFAAVTVLGWNAFVPQVLGGPAIDYAQAFGLNLLVAILRYYFK